MNTMDSLKPPIIILGAARSGTKFLRSLIALHPEVIAVPYDVNFIWKYGNYRVGHDELRPHDLSERTRRHIRRYFSKVQQALPSGRVLEKSVSNGLRVGFVQAVLPGCQFIHLIRDGRDVAASAKRMWTAPINRGDLFQKLGNLPPSGMVNYGFSYVAGYFERAMRRDHRVSSWGPRFEGIDEVLRAHTLLETCGIQWRRCVEAEIAGLEAENIGEVLEIRYEELVKNPYGWLSQILCFLSLDPCEISRAVVENMVTVKNIGRWREEISEEEMEGLISLIGPALVQLGSGV